MNKLCCLIGMFITCGFCKAQSLVPNGDFEQYLACPISFSQLNYASFWINPSTNLSNAGTPDYYNQCAPVGSIVSVPLNGQGTWQNYQPAHSGGAYCGIFLYQDGIQLREYVEAPLSSTLIANTDYQFKMYVCLLDPSKYTTDAIGVYFSDTLVSGINNWDPLPFNPQINNITANTFDTLNWTLVSGNYTASGGENFLIIGNFKVDSLTTISIVNSNTPHWYAIVLIDDVSLTLSTGIEYQNQNDELKIYPNPFTNKINITVKRNELLELTLYDITSRKIFNQSFTNSTSINTEQLAKGIYLYEVRNKNGVIKKGKVVKD